jgi:hypothetical protein
MSAFEQRREVPNRAFQYLVVSRLSSAVGVWSELAVISSLQNRTRRSRLRYLRRSWWMMRRMWSRLGNIGMRMRRFIAVNSCSSRDMPGHMNPLTSAFKT